MEIFFRFKKFWNHFEWSEALTFLRLYHHQLNSDKNKRYIYQSMAKLYDTGLQKAKKSISWPKKGLKGLFFIHFMENEPSIVLWSHDRFIFGSALPFSGSYVTSSVCLSDFYLISPVHPGSPTWLLVDTRLIILLLFYPVNFQFWVVTVSFMVTNDILWVLSYKYWERSLVYRC